MARKVKISLIAIIAIIFLLFYTVGYDMLWDENPDFGSPLLTPAILWLIVIMLAATIATAGIALVISLKKHNYKHNINGIPIKKIGLWTCLAVLVLLGGSFLLSDSNAIIVNGKVYDDKFWLNMADVLLLMSIILIIATIALTVFATLKKHLPTRKNMKNEPI